jgi:3-methyladenine DNA glycosylase AlkC
MGLLSATPERAQADKLLIKTRKHCRNIFRHRMREVINRGGI